MRLSPLLSGLLPVLTVANKLFLQSPNFSIVGGDVSPVCFPSLKGPVIDRNGDIICHENTVDAEGATYEGACNRADGTCEVRSYPSTLRATC